jgi:hypothetical protein
MDRNIDRLGAACRRHGAGANQQRCLSQSACADDVPFGAGGPGDIFARLIGQKLSQQLGQQFNRPAAGGNIGAGVAARAPADGYTLLVGSSTLWATPRRRRTPPARPRPRRRNRARPRCPHPIPRMVRRQDLHLGGTPLMSRSPLPFLLSEPAQSSNRARRWGPLHGPSGQVLWSVGHCRHLG